MNKLNRFAKSMSVAAGIMLAFGVSADAYAGYKLPYKSGTSYTVTKGPTNHTGKEAGAVDFGMPKGTGVLASQAGTVTKMQMSYTKGGGCDSSLMNKANYIVIKHADGNSTLYLHLQENSANVKVDDKVAQGAVIAKSSNTGYSCGTNGGYHLHFQLQDSCSSWYCQAKPVTFDEVGKQLKTMDKPVSKNPK